MAFVGPRRALLASTRLKPAASWNFAAQGQLPWWLTLSRASNAWYFNSSGTLTQASSNVARFDYDPSTLAAKGLLLEGARTNNVANNSAVGAVAGSARTVVAITALSRSGSATAVASAAGHNLAVNDLVTISGATGANASEYNGTFKVSAVSAGVSFSYVTSTSRTDSVTGASYTAMSPGTYPTGITSFISPSGVANVVTAVGTVNGMPYFSIRFAGLPSSTAEITTYLTSVVASSTGSFYAGSAYLAMPSGSMSNLISSLRIFNLNSGAYVREDSVAITPTSALTRYQKSGTQSGVTNQSQLVYSLFAASSNVPIDVTIQFVAMQFEPLSSASQVASSPILTTGSALTRSADIATIGGVPAQILASAQGTALVETTQYANATGVNGRLIGLSANAPLYLAAADGKLTSNTSGGTNLSTTTTPSWTTGARGIVGWNSSGRSVIGTGTALATDALTGTWSGPFYFGSANGTLTADGWYSRAAFWSTRQSDTTLASKVIMGAPL